MTKPCTELDVDQTYYTLKFLYERVQWDNKSQSERNQAMYDLVQYTEAIKRNIQRLPQIWYLVYLANQEADAQTLARHMIYDCKPYK